MLIAVDLQWLTSAVGAYLVAWFAKWLVIYFWLNVGVWLSIRLAGDAQPKQLWSPPMPWLAIGTLFATEVGLGIASRGNRGLPESLEDLPVFLALQAMVAIVGGGYFVHVTLEYKYPRSFAITAFTFVATMTTTALIYFGLVRPLTGGR